MSSHRSEPAHPSGVHAPAEPQASRRAFLGWIRAAGPAGREFLQLWIRSIGEHHFEIRHQLDRMLPRRLLHEHRDPFAAREIAKTTETGAHRPLTTSPNLSRGWLITLLDEPGLLTAMDYFYPAGVRHWHAGLTGTLEVTSWEETAARQSGIYSAVRLVPADAVRNTVEACCADAVCLRTVAWSVEDVLPPPTTAVVDDEKARLPCPEACSLFISLARKVLLIEREPRQEIDGLGPVSGEEVAQLREIALAAADGILGAVREGDFEAATNERRMRYLAARLRTASAKSNGIG